MASLASRKHGRHDVGLQEKNKKVESAELGHKCVLKWKEIQWNNRGDQKRCFFFAINRELYVFLDADHPALIYLWRSLAILEFTCKPKL